MYKSTSLRLAVLCLSAVALALICVGFISSSATSADDQVVNSLGTPDSIRRVSLPTNDIVFNAVDNKLYASVPGSAGPIGNSITPVDPYAGTIGTAVWIGSEPSKLALSSDGQTLYTYLTGAFSVGRYNIATQTAAGKFLVGHNLFDGLWTASDIAVSPDDPNILAVARRNPGTNTERGVAIFSNGTLLAQTNPSSFMGSDFLAFESGTTLYGSGGSSGLRRYTVGDASIAVTSQASLAFGASLKFANGTIFTSSGQVINASTMSLLGTFAGVNGSPFVPDTSVGRSYHLVRQDSPANTWVLKAFDISTQAEVGSLPIANVIGTATSLVRWGTNGLAFRTTAGEIFLIQTSLIPTPNPIPPPSPTPTVTPTPTPTPYSIALREVSLPANDLVYVPGREKFLATVASSAGVERGNSLTEIDPTTGTFGSSTWIGSEPSQIAVTDDGSTLFVGLNGAGGFRRFDLATSTAGPLVAIGGNSTNGPGTAFDLDAVPGSNDSVGISRLNGGIVVFDSGVQRPTVGSGGLFLEFAAPDVLFSHNPNLTKHNVQPGGVTQVSQFNPGIVGDIEIRNSLIYPANGRVIDTSFTAVAGTYAGLESSNASVIDPTNSRVFFLTESVGNYSLRGYELDTFRFIGSIPLPNLGQVPRKLVRWGTNGLAFRVDGRVYIIQTNLVDGGAPVPTPTPTPTVTPTPTPTPAATFVRRVNLVTNDLIYDAGTNAVIATVPGTGGTGVANTITHVSPANGQITASVPIGTDPSIIAPSDDGQTLYTRLSGGAIRRYNLATQTAGIQFTGPSSFANPADIAVVPGSPDVLAAGTWASGVALFNNGVFQGPMNGSGSGATSLDFSNDPNILYAYDNQSSGFSLSKFTIGPGPVTWTQIASNLLSGFGAQIEFVNDSIYSTSGRVANPQTASLLGTFGNGGSTMAIDQAANRIFFMNGSVLSAYDMQTFLKVGSVTISGFNGTPTSLARWGANGLVFRAPTSGGGNDSQIYLVQSALVSTAAPIPTGLAFSTTLTAVPEAQTNATVSIIRSGDATGATSVDYATADGTAIAGQDYTARTGTVTFNPGETQKFVTVPLINDNIFEGTQSFTVNLSNAIGANTFIVTPNPVTVNITDNDLRPTISVITNSVQEPNLGRNATVNVEVRLTNPSEQTITVSSGTANGSATAGADYITAGGQLTFNPLDTVKTVPIQILPDTLMEPNETFIATLFLATNATIATNQALITIRNLNHAAHVFDFDGDGKTDIGIFRPTGGEWWYIRSTDGQVPAFPFGSSADRITPADFTGDGKTDVAFWRPATGEWYVLRSEDQAFYAFPFGTSGDIPVPADYDADGKADAAIFRPSNATWYIPRSSDGEIQFIQFGATGDVPTAADYDGDGKADIAIYRPSVGQWWMERSTAGPAAFQFGTSTDKPVQGDYTGDGKTDVAVWRPSTGEWLILRSEDSNYYAFPFGADGDIPAPGDYDGDGRHDAAVFRPAGANWFISRSTAGTQIVQFGSSGDRPLPNAYVP